MATSHDVCTMPKVASVVNVPPYTWSSHSGEGMARALINQDEALEDDFQTQHMPVHHVMQQEDDGRRSSAEGRLEYSGGSLGQWTEYQIDIGEEETLETVDPTWRTTRWLQLAVQGRRWQWPKGKVWEVGVSPLVRAFWEKTGVELTASCTKLCWELLPRGVFRRRGRGTISHAITFLDDVAMHVPTPDAWDQFVWLPSAAVPWATTEVEQYGYHCGHAIDLGPVMPVMQFRVTDEEGTYLCVARVLVFEGRVLAYNPTRDEAEWVPARSVANDLSCVEERSAVALVNYVPCIPQEADRIAELRAHHLMGWPDDSSEEEEDDGQMEEEDGEQEGDKPEGDEHEEAEGQGEADPESLSSGMALEQGETEQEVKPRGQRRSQE